MKSFIKHTLAVTAITAAVAALAIPMTNYAFLYGSWMGVYWMHFGIAEFAALLVYFITLDELSKTSDTSEA